MTRLEDIRKAVEGTIGTLTPAKAQQLAKGLLEPGAAKERVTKLAGDLVEWSQRNRERIADLVRAEVAVQMRRSGAASQADLEALQKRVRELERATGKAGTRKTAAAKKRAGTSRAKSSASKAAPKTSAASGSKATDPGAHAAAG
jgi:polyhydroxyalkanoate synthesis regulator phasin